MGPTLGRRGALQYTNLNKARENKKIVKNDFCYRVVLPWDRCQCCWRYPHLDHPGPCQSSPLELRLMAASKLSAFSLVSRENRRYDGNLEISLLRSTWGKNLAFLRLCSDRWIFFACQRKKEGLFYTPIFDLVLTFEGRESPPVLVFLVVVVTSSEAYSTLNGKSYKKCGKSHETENRSTKKNPSKVEAVRCVQRQQQCQLFITPSHQSALTFPNRS